jgi:sensor histidine kinase YesM
MEKAMRLFDKTFIKRWLIHAAAIWLLLAINSTFGYVYHVSILNDHFFTGLTNPDGTAFSSWQYFTRFYIGDHSFEQALFILAFAFLVELNYQWVAKRMSKGVLYVAATSVVFALGVVAVQLASIYWSIYVLGHSVTGFVSDLVNQAFIYVAYFVCYAFIRYFIENQQYLAQKSQVELSVLKAQLNPHFFFNALNSLYGTALQEKATKTSGMIEQLSGIMRYTMGEGQNTLTNVQNELDFIDNYWALQEVRLPQRDSIRLSKRLFFDEKAATIAPLLLIPYIENAFKYGISIDHDCLIDLDISVKEQRLTMQLSNSIQSDKTLEKGNGIGLENARKRLDLMYNDRYTLAQSQDGDVYKVVLTLQLT